MNGVILRESYVGLPGVAQDVIAPIYNHQNKTLATAFVRIAS